MRDERDAFFALLLGRCSPDAPTCLTLTAIHPDGQHPTPSRHIPLNQFHANSTVFAVLDAANRQGWGAYFAVGLRRPGLNRWQRGRVGDVVALPALFVDVDDPSPDTLSRLRDFCLTPSCILHSGGGYHAYWWLDRPTNDLMLAGRILRGLAAALDGDPMSVAQSLRLVGSINTKPRRDGARCRIIQCRDHRFRLEDFAPLLPPLTRPRRIKPVARVPDGDAISRIAGELVLQGYRQRGDWLNGACPFPERHRHADRHPSFGFNTRTGYGYCHVCGSMLIKELCSVLAIETSLRCSGSLF